MNASRTGLCLVSLAFVLAACGDDTQTSGSGAQTGGGADGTSSAGATVSSADATAVSASSASTGEPEVCPWPGEDPGTLAATGAAIGDVIENVSGLVDQCGVARRLWDFAGGYRILSMTPGW